MYVSGGFSYRPMKKLILVCLMACLAECVSAQGSVGYYPWTSLLSISTNPDKKVWLDTRFQTNSLFSSLSMDLLPMINLRRREVVQVYLGGGIRINPLYRIADPTAKVLTLDGYSLNLGVRVSPFERNRGVQLALELNPYARHDLANGVMKSHFGLVYVFGKHGKGN